MGCVLSALGALVVVVSICLASPSVAAQDRPDSPAALVQLFYDAYPKELDGGLPRGNDLDWIADFLSDRLYGRFRSVLEYQGEWIRRNRDGPVSDLKPPFADGLHFSGTPDAISLFRVLRAQVQSPGIWHVPIHFWIDEDLDGWEALVVVKQERSRYVIDDIIFLPADPNDKLWCLSESLEWRESE